METQSFKDFKNNNPKGDILTTNDIIKCIQKNGVIYAEIVKDLKNHNEKNPLTPVDVDEDGFISFSKAIDRSLKKYLNGEKISHLDCPECGSEKSLIMQEGCYICKNCGWSKCS